MLLDRDECAPGPDVDPMLSRLPAAAAPPTPSPTIGPDSVVGLAAAAVSQTRHVTYWITATDSQRATLGMINTQTQAELDRFKQASGL